MGDLFSGRKTGVGFGKQSAEGTPLSNPTYTVPTFGATPQIDQDAGEVEFASGSLEPQVENKDVIRLSGSPEIPVYADSIGVPILNAMGTVATSGTDPFTHSFHFAANPAMNSWFWRVGDEYFRGEDVRLDKLEFGWEAGKPLRATCDVRGKKGERLTAAYNLSNPSDLGAYFTYVGATMKLVVSGSSVAQVRSIKSGKVRLLRELDLIQTDRIHPEFVHPKRSIMEVELDLVLEDWDFVRATFFGGAANDTVSAALVNGAIDLRFKQGATNELMFISNKISLRAGFPEPAVGGDAVALKLAGRALTESTTPNVRLVNSTASY